MWSADGGEIVLRCNWTDTRVFRNNIADAPSGNRIGLSHGENRNGSMFCFGKASNADVSPTPDESLIGFVRQNQQIVFFSEFADGFEFLTAEDLAGRITRIAQQDSPDTFVPCILESGGRNGKVRLGQFH